MRGAGRRQWASARASRASAMRELLDGYAFEDVYGHSRGRNIAGAGRAAVGASFDRYLAAVAA